MTDQITDQDRRDARQWATNVSEQGKSPNLPLTTAARVILATVDAPEPTLADELRVIEDRRLSLPGIWGRLRDLAARAERIEHERDEACAAIEIADWRHWYRENNELRVEVERLTAERDAETVAPGENVAADQQVSTQGILAGSLPDHTDVKPGVNTD